MTQVKLCSVCFRRIAYVGCRCESCGGAAPVDVVAKQQRTEQREAQHGVDFSEDLAALLSAMPESH